MNNKRLIKIAKVISTLFMPLYAPLWVFFGLFLFSYMRMLPWSYKLFIMGLVYFFAAGHIVELWRLSGHHDEDEYGHVLSWGGDVGTDLSDCLCDHQCLVEGQYTHGGYGWLGGRTQCVQHLVLLQSRVAVLRFAAVVRCIGY